MKAPIQKIKRKSKGGKRISCRKLALEMDTSFSSAYRILRKDLKMKSYRITVEFLLKDEHKAQPNWPRKEFRKEDTMRILFSNEKIFDLDGIYNSQNDRTGGGKIIGPPLVNAKKLTFYFKKRSVRLVNIFDRNIGICDILVCLYSLFSSFKCM